MLINLFSKFHWLAVQSSLAPHLFVISVDFFCNKFFTFQFWRKLNFRENFNFTFTLNPPSLSNSKCLKNNLISFDINYWFKTKKFAKDKLIHFLTIIYILIMLFLIQITKMLEVKDKTKIKPIGNPNSVRFSLCVQHKSHLCAERYFLLYST